MLISLLRAKQIQYNCFKLLLKVHLVKKLGMTWQIGVELGVSSNAPDTTLFFILSPPEKN